MTAHDPLALPYERLLGQYDPIHPDVKFGKSVRVGECTVIERGCSIGDNVLIGNFVVLRPNITVGHDTKITHYASAEEGAKIGNHCKMGQYSCLTKEGVLEDWVFYGAGTVSLNAKNIMYGRRKSILEPIRVCRGARVGAQVLILPGIVIGENALIGAKSLVTHNVPAGEIWYGSPASKQGDVPREEWL